MNDQNSDNRQVKDLNLGKVKLVWYIKSKRNKLLIGSRNFNSQFLLPTLTMNFLAELRLFYFSYCDVATTQIK
jgi:hypothetical protein